MIGDSVTFSAKEKVDYCKLKKLKPLLKKNIQNS